MKVCLLTHNVKAGNGGGNLSRKLIEGLVASGHQYSLLTQIPSNFPLENCVLHANKLALLSKFFVIRSEIKKCDVIHAVDIFPFGFIAMVAGAGLGKKLVLSLVGSGSIIPLYKFYSSFCKVLLRRAYTVMAISNYVKQEVLKKVPGINIRVLSPGVEFHTYHSPSTAKIEVPQNYILSVGALRWRKGYKHSINAFAKISDKYPDLHYLIVGRQYDPVMYKKLKTFIKEHNLEHRIRIIETVDDIEQLKYVYQHAKLFILMSEHLGHDVEGFGLVFLEAAAAGIPVIGTTKSGIADAIDQSKNGFLVDASDATGAAEAMDKILSDDALRLSMAEHSVEWAKKNDWSIKLEALMKIYEEL